MADWQIMCASITQLACSPSTNQLLHKLRRAAVWMVSETRSTAPHTCAWPQLEPNVAKLTSMAQGLALYPEQHINVVTLCVHAQLHCCLNNSQLLVQHVSRLIKSMQDTTYTSLQVCNRSQQDRKPNI
eukprot:GHRR01000941.1.p3 GENE.GHRR01000941.1~~GHRR01000941.1.p3  ORF type:complete len:128 (-),score=18.30 GHRR01000941.1:148-531(-)